MTETRRWLESHRAVFLRRYGIAVGMGAAGVICLAFAMGLGLEHAGAYRRLPSMVLLGWAIAGGALALSGRVFVAARRAVALPSLATRVESEGARRRGSVAGPASWVATSGGALAAYADRQVAGWLAAHGEDALAATRRTTSRALAAGGGVLAAGALLLVAALPWGDEFWKPWTVLLSGDGQVELTVDRALVRRGESVTASVAARGRTRADLWVRAPGEAWTVTELGLDSTGHAGVTLETLDSDRYLRAVSGGRESPTLHVRVQLPALLASLELAARFPDYLERADEPLAHGDDPVPLPIGTRVLVRGRATVPLSEAVWRSEARAHPLAVDGTGFEGELSVSESGRWALDLVVGPGHRLDGDPPRLAVVAVPDSAPVVRVPVPGADTVAPLSLRQPLLVDARDDHGLGRVELVSWRVSRLGVTGAPDTAGVPLPAERTDRAVLHWVLDLNERGFLPGDTAFFQAVAWDDAPVARRGVSEVFTLRLPSMEELRRDARERTRALGEDAGALVAEQSALARRLEDLAAEREREARQEEELRRGAQVGDRLPFEAAERARELLATEEHLVRRAEQMRQDLQRLADAAWAAGMTDPAFHEELRDLRDLLSRALSEDLMRRLEALREALARLDASDVRDALSRLAASAEELREELRRSRDLFERAALEGQLTSLADDAEELAARQGEWMDRARHEADSGLAAPERELAERADSLAGEIEQLDRGLDASVGREPGQLGPEQRRAEAAGREMRRAASEVERGHRAEAQRAGAAARQELDPLAEELRAERDAMREAWREEAMAQLDRAMVETVGLALRQAEIGSRVARGESGADVRGAQAALREGMDRLLERLRSAAGMNALVSPQLGTALGTAQERMTETVTELQQATPNTRQAGASAGQALDALNGLAYALLDSRAQVLGAESGSGMQEAMERLAQLADQQGAIGGATGAMLSSLPPSREELMQALQTLAAEQQALADQLDRLHAGGDVSGAGQLADEAREIARLLEEGQIGRELVERQQRLFRRLLDAGRTLRSDEEDERLERVSEAARPGNLRRPDDTLPAAGPLRFRIPTWEELRGLSAEERRLVLEYFRRLNAGGR